MQVNGKLYKAAFTKAVYEARTGQTVTQYDKQFSSFKKEHKKDISSRNLIREMFLEVRVMLHSSEYR